MRVRKRDFRTMTDVVFQEAVRAIIRSSSSKDEVKQRVAQELKYPYQIDIYNEEPTDEVGSQALSRASATKGVAMRNGAVVVAMFFAKDGRVLSV